MPRHPRWLLPGIPRHITQRGVNRGATFIDADDHRLYLALLAEVLADHGIGIHASALMGNHVHLLITPACGSGLSRAMRSLNQRYVGAFNLRYARTGPCAKALPVLPRADGGLSADIVSAHRPEPCSLGHRGLDRAIPGRAQGRISGS